MSRRPPSARDLVFVHTRTSRVVQQMVPGSLGGKVRSARQVPDAVRASVASAQSSGDGSAGAVFLEAIIVGGSASVGTNVMPPGMRVPQACTLGTVVVRVGTAPVGASLVVVVRAAGTVVATVTVPSGATSASVSPGVALSRGQALTFDVTSVGSSTPGSNVAVAIEAF